MWCRSPPLLGETLKPDAPFGEFMEGRDEVAQVAA